MVFSKGETSDRQRQMGKSLVFGLSEETKNKLELLAQRRQISQGALCRFAITKFLEQESQNDQRQKNSA